MILLKKITLDNFLSHEHTEIVFDKNEKALIDGPSGAGKSTIFDSIIWALYGEGRADNKSMVRKGTKKATVTLELLRSQGAVDGGDETIIITRSASATGKHSLDITREDSSGSREALPLSGVKEIQAWIDNELIGASYLLFVNSVAYVQGNSESFVVQSASKRKELLLEIIKAEDYDKLYENARQKLSLLDGEKQRATGQITELESRVGALLMTISRKNLFITQIAELTSLADKLDPEIKKLEEESVVLRAHAQTIDLLNSSLITVNKDIDATTVKISEKKEKVKAKQEINDKIERLSLLDEKISSINSELVQERKDLQENSEIETKRNAFYARKPVVKDRSGEMKRHEEMIALLEKKETCPAGIKCPYHSKNLDSIKEHFDEITKLGDLTVVEVQELSAWILEEKSLPDKRDINSIVSKISQLEATKSSYELERNEIVSLKKDLEYIAAIEKEIPVLEQELIDLDLKRIEIKNKKAEAEKVSTSDNKDIDIKLAKLKNEQNTFRESIAHNTAMLKLAGEAEEELKTVNEKIKTIKEVDIKKIEEQAQKVALVKDAFGSRGIKTVVIDYLLPKLEDKINEVLSKLSDFRVRLDTQTKTSDGEGIKEGLFITILNELNEEMPFEAYSGGEKLKISVSISEALASLQKVGFRLFDETFIGLDENSTESFADVLSGLQSNFNQVFCISHLLQIKELFDKKITVVKRNSISTVV